MSSAHKGSRLILKNAVNSVDFSTAHFDYNIDATGIHSGELVEPLSGAIYTMRPNEGRFSGGVAVEAGTTNHYTTKSIVDSGATLVVESWSEEYNGNPVVKITKSIGTPATHASYRQCISSPSTIPYSSTCTLSFKAKVLSGSVSSIGRHFGGGTSAMTYSRELGNGWYYYEYTGISPSGGGLCVGVGFVGDPALECLIAEMQLEVRQLATSFTDGTRNNNILSYPKSLFNSSSFTINMWASFDVFLASTYQPFLEICSSAHQKNRVLIMYRDNEIRFWSSDAVSEVSTGIGSAQSLMGGINSWAMITFSFDGSTYTLSINGVPVIITASTIVSTPTGTLNIGGRYWGQLGGRMCDVAILNRCASQEEVESWHVSNAGVYNPHDFRSFAI